MLMISETVGRADVWATPVRLDSSTPMVDIKPDEFIGKTSRRKLRAEPL